MSAVLVAPRAHWERLRPHSAVRLAPSRLAMLLPTAGLLRPLAVRDSRRQCVAEQWPGLRRALTLSIGVG